MYVYTLHATISLHCNVISDISSTMPYIQCMFCSERMSFYSTCIVHEYIVCESIFEGAQNMTKAHVHTKEQLTVATIQLGGPETMET